ncbi:MAG: glycoside hydrolase family 9 protein [Lachnospiraceae bacterium]|nr:glycoside hydrolase family 9 protein [Lachnospiraceae bacterium]
MDNSKAKSSGFQLDKELGYFKNHGVSVMAFQDIYPAGHQSGVSIIMHGNRITSNGDVRFEPTPAQWQPVPKQKKRIFDEASNTIVTRLGYPDYENHLRGFNPMIYPDYEFEYEVRVTGEGASVVVTVDLDQPIPEEFVGKLCFNMELFPGLLFGKPWMMDDKQGIFPRQANGPTVGMPSNYLHSGKLPVKEGIRADLEHLSGGNQGYNPIIADDIIAQPYAVGKRFTMCPDEPHRRLTIESVDANLKLYDGRMNHNNGWFVLSSELPAGRTKQAVCWRITPNVVEEWLYPPVVQTSQVGYHPKAVKVAVIELDDRETAREDIVLYKLTENGAQKVRSGAGKEWGKFLRYHYLQFDFSDIREEGLYKICYGSSQSAVFRIAEDIYERGVWQPVLEYFLPVQMCHMRVNEKYRVWHGLCHNDDARMAPVNWNHFDGYVQGPSTLTKYQPGEEVPGLNVGGWHDAGDFDLRIESQSGEAYILSLTYEEFGVDYDVTTIDQQKKITEIHQPDGKNDILQQIEHGVLTVVAGYEALGRLYRGIIANDLRQYVLLGDASAMTDGIRGNADDRWVFTEDNPYRELMTAAHLAATTRALKGFNDVLAEKALRIAEELYEITRDEGKAKKAKVHAAVELYLSTNKQSYLDFLVSETEFICTEVVDLGWIVSRVVRKIDNAAFVAAIAAAMLQIREQEQALSAETPYGIPYRPHIWGAGWSIQGMGVQYYFMYKAFPEIFRPELLGNALNFVLGCHPGSNTASFASGVGAKSATVAYGANRADWSYIPGGVISGTALIRPDFPELLEFPFLWQQTEYVLGGGSSNYMFLVLAVQRLLQEN